MLAGRRLVGGRISCIENLLLSMFKNLIYIFVVILCVSFGIMIYMVAEPSDDVGLEREYIDRLEYMEEYLNTHPSYYGLTNTNASSMEEMAKEIKESKNVTGGLLKIAADNIISQRGILNSSSERKERNAYPGMLIHPIYVELQKKSPMGLRKKYNISEVDMEGASIGLHEMYTQYVSESLPLIMRNGCKDWRLKKEVDEKVREGGLSLENYLNSMFDAGTTLPVKASKNVEYTRLTRNSVQERFQ